MMRILVTGNAGYIGPVLGRYLKKMDPGYHLIGFDSGFFAHCLTSAQRLPETAYDIQHFGDIREIDPSALKDVDAVVHLAAVFQRSNWGTDTKRLLTRSMQEPAFGWPRLHKTPAFAGSCLPPVAACTVLRLSRRKRKQIPSTL